jgi:hypothetical protein
MITFRELGRYGRLGNQLFQYAMLRSVSLETGYEMKIPDPATMCWADVKTQPCLLGNYNIKCDYLEEADIAKIKYNVTEKLSGHTYFNPQLFSVPDGTNFHGYFQNSQYFMKHAPTIRHDLSLQKDLEEEAEEYIQSLKSNNEQIVSVHFRRGDNTDGHGGIVKDYYGPNDSLSKDSPFGSYFYRALEEFNGHNVKFLVFSGGTRDGMQHNQGDVDWCKEHLKDDRFIFCEGKSDIEDFAAMKNCDHHIASHSTSFGYWAAFLNPNEDKIVIAPTAYTIPDDGRASRGFYPPTWKTI